MTSNQPGRCPNCGSDQIASFCAQCGQNDRDYQRSLPPLLWDLVKETFEVDSRIARTLKLLLFVPGELTAEFSRNRRASYVSPFRLYLFINLLFFLLVSLTTDLDSRNLPDTLVIDAGEEAPSAEQGQVLYLLLPAEQHEQLDSILARPDSSLRKSLLLGITDEFAPTVEQDAQGEIVVDPITRFLFSQLVAAVADPGRMIGDLVDNLPVVLFVMLPFYALLLSLLYRRRRRYYVENLVFITHLHSFAFFIYTAMLLIPQNETLDYLLMGTLAVYHFAALKRYFGDGYLRTAVKFTIQIWVYFALLLPASFAVVALFTLAMV